MIDSHCHLFFDSLKNNFLQIIERAIENNITAILSINTEMDNFDAHYDLIKNYKSIFISCGQHPENVTEKNIVSTENIILNCNKHKKVIGIGETGIDLYHSSNNIKSQYKSFENHIEASYETSLPLIIHQWNSENEIMDVLKNYQKNRPLNVVFHCFTGTKKLRNFCIDNNYYISISGIITFKNANELRSVIKSVPLYLLMCETDSPFLSPVPYRGKTNEPSYVNYVYKYLANFYNLSIEELTKKTDNNFYSLFKKAIHYKEISHEK